MCHGCVYSGSFVLDCSAFYLQHFMSFHIHKIEISYRAFLERVSPRILSLESVDYFGTSTSVVEKKKLSELVKLRVLLENQDRGSRIGDGE